jgi:AraC-like DNA-binding protein
MTSGPPLVRASDIAPFLRWLRENDRPLESSLEAAHLPVAPWEEPDRLIPLVSALEVMRSLAASEGPDIGCRVVLPTSILELGSLGTAMLDGRTPREAINRLCAAMDHHSSHEQITMAPAPGGAVIREDIDLKLDDETRHITQQYVAALFRSLLRLTGFSGEPLRYISMTSHPRFGLDHLRGLLGAQPVATATGRLSIFVPDDVLDRPFSPDLRASNASPSDGDTTPLRDVDFRRAAVAFIAARFQVDGREPSLGQFAAAGGLSARTIQRRLAEENASFSALVDEVRRTRALADLGDHSTPIASIAADLGYSGQQAFTRAVRRWAGNSPREVRKRARH